MKAKIETLKLMSVVLHLFDGNMNNTNVTTDNDLSVEMKTYYSDYLIDNAEPRLVHGQFGQKQPIPRNSGKTIEFRRYSQLPKILVPLVEGYTPAGQKLNTTNVTATVAQYGGFVELSDFLLMTAIDNNLAQAIKLLGSQGGRSIDTVDREVLNGGTNVQYAGGKTARFLLIGGEASGNTYLTVTEIKKAVRYLKAMNAERINGDYVAVINQDCTYDLTEDPDWKYPHQYVDTKEIYNGEIGKIAGVRFAETSEAKIFHAEDLMEADTAGSSDGERTLTVASWTAASLAVTVDEKISTAQATALAGRKVIINNQLCEVVSATAGAAGAAVLTLKAAPTTAPADGDVVYPGEAGAKGRDVYSTLIFGENAYGITGIAGGEMETIIKQLGSGGTYDPLNQRATAGWKASHACVRLVEEYMIRIESTSTFNDLGAN